MPTQREFTLTCLQVKLEKLWTVLYRLKCSATKDGGGDEENSASRKPLSDASVLLLLVLTNHCTDQVRMTFDQLNSDRIRILPTGIFEEPVQKRSIPLRWNDEDRQGRKGRKS